MFLSYGGLLMKKQLFSLLIAMSVVASAQAFPGIGGAIRWISESLIGKSATDTIAGSEVITPAVVEIAPVVAASEVITPAIVEVAPAIVVASKTGILAKSKAVVSSATGSIVSGTKRGYNWITAGLGSGYVTTKNAVVKGAVAVKGAAVAHPYITAGIAAAIVTAGGYYAYNKYKAHKKNKQVMLDALMAEQLAKVAAQAPQPAALKDAIAAAQTVRGDYTKEYRDGIYPVLDMAKVTTIQLPAICNQPEFAQHKAILQEIAGLASAQALLVNIDASFKVPAMKQLVGKALSIMPVVRVNA